MTSILRLVLPMCLPGIADHPASRIDDFLPWNWKAQKAAAIAAAA
jgi:hypothetical protein